MDERSPRAEVYFSPEEEVEDLTKFMIDRKARLSRKGENCRH